MATRVAATNKWYVLFIMTAIMSVHHIDRNVMNVIIEPVKHEFGLSDAAMGMLTGLGHSAALALFVLPMGWLADRTNRVKLMSGAVTIWSALTGLGALATGFPSLLLMRFGVGAAEAAGPPAVISLLSDVFRGKERPTAMGIYYLHVAVGTSIIFLTGGWVAHHFGWRAAFLLAGIPGLLLGILLLLTVREPARERDKSKADGGKTASLRDVGTMVRTNRTLQFSLAGGTMATIAQASVWAWMASFFMRNHGLDLVEVGVLIAIVAGPAKGFGSLISGPMIRRLSGDRPRELWRYPAIALCLSVPVAWAMVLAPTAWWSIAFSIVLGVVLGGWAAPITVILMTGVPSNARATSAGIYHLSTNLIGTGCGPLITGAISDLMGGDRAIGAALGIALSINILSAGSVWIACRGLSATSAPDEAADI
jgi:MFS family permease